MKILSCFVFSFSLLLWSCNERDAHRGGRPRDGAVASRSDSGVIVLADGRVIVPDGGSIIPESDAGSEDPDSGSGTVTQNDICHSFFDEYCGLVIECGTDTPGWDAVSECVDAFLSDCCGGGCSRTRGDVSWSELLECQAYYQNLTCSTMESIWTHETCGDSLVWDS